LGYDDGSPYWTVTILRMKNSMKVG
jgi:hypothetical protein